MTTPSTDQPPVRQPPDLSDPDIRRRLRRPFLPREHGFVNGRPYILKAAIRERLNEVDAHWEISSPLTVNVGETVILTAALTVLGVTRYDLGAAIFTRTGRPDKDGVLPALPPYELARNEIRAFKGAMADVLPRTALNFGVGEYLKQCPRNVTDEASLTRWLDSLTRPAQPQPGARPTPGSSKPTMTLDDVTSTDKPDPLQTDWDGDTLYHYKNTATLFRAKDHFENWLNEVGPGWSGKPTLEEAHLEAQQHYNAYTKDYWLKVFEQTRAIWPGQDDDQRKANMWAAVEPMIADRQVSCWASVKVTVGILQQKMVRLGGNRERA